MSKQILVVDDEEGVRFALRTFLEDRGYEVAEARNGLEAIKTIHRAPPDLVVLDVIMSPLSGWEVLDILHTEAATATLPVLLLTALGDVQDEARGWHLGCHWYQVKQKPLNFDDLGLVIERLLAIDPEESRRVWEASSAGEEGGGE